MPKSVQADIDPVIRPSPEPPTYGYRKLHKWTDKYRVRVGDYRVIYEIHDGVLLVLVVSVGDRANIYRQFRSS
ncbi:MAG: type II toxin-antitoxin system RelE/ParE family toxin [Thermomicrobiales bacterium]